MALEIWIDRHDSYMTVAKSPNLKHKPTKAIVSSFMMKTCLIKLDSNGMHHSEGILTSSLS
jgi:hypothetical protein